LTSQEKNCRMAHSHNCTGMCYARLGDHAEARREFEAAISLDHRFADAHCNLGNTLREPGDLDGAVASYHDALEIEPERLDARLNLISTLRERHRVAGPAFATGAMVGDHAFGDCEAHGRVPRSLRKPRVDDHSFRRGVIVLGYCLVAVIMCVTFVLWILRR